MTNAGEGEKTVAEYNIFGQPLAAECPQEQTDPADRAEMAAPPVKKPPSRLAEEKKRLRPLMIAAVLLAVLIPTGLSVALESQLTQTRGELDQLRQTMDAPPPVQPEVPPPAGEDTEPETVPQEPERPAYQDLYPELYAQPHVWNVEEEGKTAYLTFDDGPSDRTPEILEVLERYGVKGTFFVVGGDSEQGRQRMRDIVAAGHTLGVHSYTHDYKKIYASVEAFLDDFAQEYNLILDATGVAPQIFRFPGGSVNAYNGGTYKEIISEMVRRGFVYYDWNRQTGDAVKKTPSAPVLVQNALKGVNSTQRIILLAHDNRRYTNVVQALPEIIEGYQAAGFSLEALTPEVRPIIFDYPR